MKTFEMHFRYRNREGEMVESTVTPEASSMPGAIGKSAREIVKGLDRKQRCDMNKNGLEISAKTSRSTTEAGEDTYAKAAAN